MIFCLDIIEPSKDTKEISYMTSTSPTSSVSIKTGLFREDEIAKSIKKNPLQEIESVGQGEEKQIRFLVWLARRYWWYL